MVKLIATKDEFDALLKTDKLVVVDFTASWCPPCQMIAPKFAELADQVTEKATLVKVDVDENADTAEECGISCMPTFQFYKGGEKVHEVQGADFEGVKSKINELA
uniref:Thioredoxin n=1 Tax=Strombidium inclinatum TaxID=197538 RepID=A0A7S3MX70_9SPIT|mmetsp:Transcript_25221/g.39047  ORF Transcript_25221/g.39047 Transcript_25221/m.39047 type:complete len:105 (+) Transcript_25221:19-333(+)|eukprot:CAMPEP_0170491386 /NCGR_PEP_ID=MMETSP0208-20121228/10921_1 /TAXON_ID=197538 /ORGANISM="Strombidium inclinatum, Strain S3" /LENGTH=104 /DNA_ID=CAMNT_0010766951 /DNA_START=19 /DNA_END=333 /DNA_ORIENTATION=-